MREVNNNMYRVSAYFWAKVTSELPACILNPTLQASIIYFAIGFNQNDATKFPIFITIMVLLYNTYTGLGYVLGTSFSNPIMVSIMTPILVVPFMLFAGFFLK